jgi:hypothetical protein
MERGWLEALWWSNLKERKSTGNREKEENEIEREKGVIIEREKEREIVVSMEEAMNTCDRVLIQVPVVVVVGYLPYLLKYLKEGEVAEVEVEVQGVVGAVAIVLMLAVVELEVEVGSVAVAEMVDGKAISNLEDCIL